MKVSHEVPRCLLTAQEEFNDYLYCLPHLLDEDDDYRDFFIAAGINNDYIIMDNSLHELGEAYNSDRLRHWIDVIRPDEFIVPDAWMDKDKTCMLAKHWLQYTYPDETTPIAVIQGKSRSEAIICAHLLQDLGYKKLCVSYGADWYGETDLEKAMGRIDFVKYLHKNHPTLKLHLLGCAVPQEFGWYEDASYIESIDTSNPIMAALDGTSYTEQGLTTKPKANMNDNYDMFFDELDYDLILHNTKMFRKINGLAYNQYNIPGNK